VYDLRGRSGGIETALPASQSVPEGKSLERRETNAGQRPSAVETLVGFSILTTMAIIAAVLLSLQRHPNPAVAVLERLQSAVSQPMPTLPPPPLFSLPPGITAMAPVESFSPETLSDKIDGKAELYLAAGCRGLKSQRLRTGAADGDWLEMFVYDMGSAEGAFAVFSSQRRAAAEPSELTANAYRSANALFLTHGRFYVELVAASLEAGTVAALEACARAFMADNPAGETGIGEKALFPAEGLAAESFTLIARDTFGFDRLDRTFTAQYQLPSGAALAFVSRRGSPEEAADLAQAFAGFLTAFGGRMLEPLTEPKGAQVMEVMDLYAVVFTRRDILAGVWEAENRTVAADLARRLAQQLEEASHAIR
jgi:hypothetical protein